MAKRRYGVSEARIARWVDEGRGTGRGRAYKPWLTIHDVPSEGLAVRLQGATTRRIHHLLSGVERAVFLECDWSQAVVDIREQFPLSRAITRKIAEEMGVRHPRVDRTDVVMTTDLLIDIVGQDGSLSFDLPAGCGRRQLAISVKNAEEALSALDLEKLEIERRYWRSRGVDWQLIFKADMPEKQWLKLMWLHEWRSLDFMPPIEARVFRSRCKTVLAAVTSASDASAGRFTDRLDREQGWPTGTTLSALRHLSANRRLVTSVDHLYDAWGPISQFALPHDLALDLVA